ncbi:MAG: hypothetical protein AAGC46_08040 [Solirubrobacteraceae bacterium]|nr:hypothetical protein [Patulibacter sp.]
MPQIHPGRSGALRRAAVVALSATMALTAAQSAHAAATVFSFSVETQPGDYGWDGGGAPAPTQTFGYYGASVSQRYAPDGTALCGAYDEDGNAPSCATQQVRAGAVIPSYDPTTYKSLPITIVPGDVIQLVNRTTKAVVGATSVVPPQPVIASPLGSPSFTIARTAATTDIEVELRRRVARNVLRDTVVPGVYHWEQQTTTIADANATASTCYQDDANGASSTAVTDTLPAKPTTAPATGKTWVLVQDKACSTAHTQIPGLPFETVSTGRITSLSDTSFSGVFSVPMQAGDVIDYTLGSESSANDTTVYVSQTNVVPVGVVPPAPALKGFQFGAPSTTVKSFLKSGLRTFVTLDSPGTVTEQLTLPAPKSKKKGKKHKKTAKLPIVVATGTATTTSGGQTAQLDVLSTKEGRKALKALKGKPAKTTLTTTITDAFGHVVTSVSKLKLAGS